MSNTSHTNISGTQLPVYLQGVGKKKKKKFIPETAVRSSGRGHDMIMSKIRRKILKKIEDFYQLDLHLHSSLHLTIGQTVFAAKFFFPCLRCLQIPNFPHCLSSIACSLLNSFLCFFFLPRIFTLVANLVCCFSPLSTSHPFTKDVYNRNTKIKH